MFDRRVGNPALGRCCSGPDSEAVARVFIMIDSGSTQRFPYFCNEALSCQRLSVLKAEERAIAVSANGQVGHHCGDREEVVVGTAHVQVYSLPKGVRLGGLHANFH